jgi:hypothetical protein
MALALITLSAGDSTNAQMDHEHLLSRDTSLKDSPHPWISCDMCSSPVKFGGKFFICTSCSDVTLEHDCLLKYKHLDSPIVASGTGSTGCLNHEFLEIPRKEWKDWDNETVDGSGQTLTQWLVAMRDTYSGVDIPANYVDVFSFFDCLV